MATPVARRKGRGGKGCSGDVSATGWAMSPSSTCARLRRVLRRAQGVVPRVRPAPLPPAHGRRRLPPVGVEAPALVAAGRGAYEAPMRTAASSPGTSGVIPDAMQAVAPAIAAAPRALLDDFAGRRGLAAAAVLFAVATKAPRGVEQARLARRLGLSPQAVARAVRELGPLVTVEMAPGAKRIALSAAGLALVNRVAEATLATARTRSAPEAD